MARLPRWRHSWDWGALLLRVVLGVIMVAHGSQKLFGAFGGPGPEGWVESVRRLGFEPALLFAWLVMLVEVGGGLLIVLGVATELWALLFAFDMLTATWMIHRPRGFFVRDGGYEFTLLLMTVAISLVLGGPGRFALWNPFRRE